MLRIKFTQLSKDAAGLMEMQPYLIRLYSIFFLI